MLALDWQGILKSDAYPQEIKHRLKYKLQSGIQFHMRLYPLIALAIMLLQGCGIPQSSAEFDKTPEASFLNATVNQLVAHDYAAIESLMDSRVQQSDIQQALDRLRSTIPAGAPTRSEPVAWNFVKTTSTTSGVSSSRSANVAIEYTYPGPKWVVASASLSGEPGQFRIVSFNVEALPAPLSELNAFTLKGKSPLHYLFLLLPATACMISVHAFVRCLRTKGLKRKWLWALFTLVGFVAFSINWTNGAMFMEVLHFHFLSAAYMRTGWLGPWIVTFSIPVGALVFLWKHRAAAALSAVDA